MDADGSRLRGLKKPAETELDDVRTNPNTESTEHLDGDVPVTAPTVQHEKQTADTADAHMSVGKLEMSPKAAAKMTTSAAGSGLTSAEIWALVEDGDQVVWSICVEVHKVTSYSIDPSHFIDMTAQRDDGQFWDLGVREDQEKLEQMQHEHQPDLLIGSAPCTSFRAMLHSCKTEEQTERMPDDERQHTQACIKAYS